MKHHILAIGISKHQNAAANLSYAAKDASEFFELFNLNIGDIGYKKLLIDSEATLGQIRAALGLELQQAIARGDAFFFFYSGHGVIANDLHDEASGSHYLVPFDGTFDYVNTCIPVSYLKESFNKLKSGANLVFIDSCFSGAASKNSKGYPGPRKKEFKGLKTISNTLSGVGNLTITASKDDEEAIEDSEFKNGLFTYYLLQELDRDKGTQNFPVLDIFTPICEQVIKRAKEQYNHTQTPTLNGQLEGTITLPTFRKPVRISPQIIQVSHSPELLEAAFPSIILEIDDKTQEKLLNDLIDLVARGRDQQTTSAALISFERICYKSLKALRTDWERIFVENGDDISKIPGSVAKLEGAASQLLMIGAVVSVFGSETQMKIYSEAVVDIWQFTQGRSGLVALITVPEIILAEIVYVIGIISMARENLGPWQILLQTHIYNLHGRETPPIPIVRYRDIYYCDALGGNSPKVNDHLRQFLSSVSWLPALAPKLEGQVIDFQLQTNLLLVLLTIHNGESLWSDFARFYAQRVLPLVNKIKYKPEFRKQVANLFNIKENQIGPLFKGYLAQVAERGLGNYFWDSISPDDFLTDEDKKTLK